MSKPEDVPEMEYRFLGRSGLQVSAISLGGWLTYGGHIDKGRFKRTDSRGQLLIGSTERTFQCMKAAYDCGVNFFDCAEEYSNGESEIAMGEAIKKFGWKRNDLVVSTKVNDHTCALDALLDNDTKKLLIALLGRSIRRQPSQQ
jgi:aryl-alcohol dehydrogenase-like predicted oxidoreductase